ncbi:DUF5133 domain-containing protein [Streptomyces luteogriseus]|uniref:DUF5133 domain-containing protein n=1 Tax=Streptomyces luteogriseus TaxID=68233 RepID=UPI0037ADB8E4
MLMAHPAVLRDLIEQYKALKTLAASDAADMQARQRMEDVIYTLCVSTGTRDIEAALIEASRQLPDASPDVDSLRDGS